MLGAAPSLMATQLEEIEDAADVAVGDLARQVYLAAEPVLSTHRMAALWSYCLQGHSYPKLQILSFEDLTHTSLAKEPDDAETLVENLVGQETQHEWRLAGRRYRQRLARSRPGEGLRFRKSEKAIRGFHHSFDCDRQLSAIRPIPSAMAPRPKQFLQL